MSAPPLVVEQWLAVLREFYSGNVAVYDEAECRRRDADLVAALRRRGFTVVEAEESARG